MLCIDEFQRRRASHQGGNRKCCADFAIVLDSKPSTVLFPQSIRNLPVIQEWTRSSTGYAWKECIFDHRCRLNVAENIGRGASLFGHPETQTGVAFPAGSVENEANYFEDN